MKIFTKTFLLLVIVILSFSFSFPVYAKELEEPTLENDNEEFPLIYGMDATVNCSKLNIREEPSISSKILGKIERDTHLTVIDQTGEWFKIEYEDISGFVFWKYISFTEEEITKESNLIGTSIIHYTSSENRDTNISIACETINGIILEPNDEFRWSKIIGQTTKEKGYLTATVIVNRKYVPGLGGGVCQVSTAIYNALLDTSITPTEHHKHSLGSAYAKNDATVAYGYKDFAFENTYDFPILIETYSYKGTVFANIYKMTNN